MTKQMPADTGVVMWDPGVDEENCGLKPPACAGPTVVADVATSAKMLAIAAFSFQPDPR